VCGDRSLALNATRSLSTLIKTLISVAAVLIVGFMAVGRRLQQNGRDIEKHRPD
jgi:hypothetical protein